MWALSVALFATHTAAQSEPIALSYAESDGCPARERFIAEVRARTSKVRFDESGGTRRFSVDFSVDGETVRGRLRITTKDGDDSERVIRGADCAEVASGMALVLALAVDPEALTAPAAQLPDVPADAAPETTAGTAKPGAAKPGAAKPAPSPAPRTERPTPAPRPQRSSTLRALGVGADVWMLAGAAPEPLLAAGAHARIHWESLGLRPHVALHLLAAQTGTVGPASRIAKFRFLGSELDVCPHRFELATRLDVAGCLSTQIAALRAEGTGAPNPDAATRAFVATGPAGLFTWGPIAPFYVEFQGAALLNLTRDDFVFEQPRILVHDVPVFSFAASLSVGLAVL